MLEAEPHLVRSGEQGEMSVGNPAGAVYMAVDNFKFYAEGNIRLHVLSLVQDRPVWVWESRSVP